MHSPHMRADAFDREILRERLKPFRLHYFSRLRSTNSHAAELRRRGELFAPAVVLTSNQTAGRGRGDNTWWSSRGSLTVTFVLPVDERLEPHQLPLVAGLAVRSAAAELTRHDAVQLKWPNDIVYRSKKLGGLLCERLLKADLIGVGLNVNLRLDRAPPALRDRITSLACISGEPIDMTEALLAVAAHLRLALQRATEQPFATLLREYDGHHALIARRVSVATGADEPPACGRCEGLDSMGRLLVRGDGKLHHVIAGHVRVL